MVTSYAAIAVAWLLLQPAPPAKRLDLTEYLRAGYAGVKADLIAAAENMPEADYGFKPSSMPEVRTFGETIAHVAAAQMRLCARLRGMPDETPTIAPTSKAEVLKVLAASFAACDAAFASLTDATSSEFITQGPVEIPKNAALVGLLARRDVWHSHCLLAREEHRSSIDGAAKKKSLKHWSVRVRTCAATCTAGLVGPLRAETRARPSSNGHGWGAPGDPDRWLSVGFERSGVL